MQTEDEVRMIDEFGLEPLSAASTRMCHEIWRIYSDDYLPAINLENVWMEVEWLEWLESVGNGGALLPLGG